MKGDVHTVYKKLDLYDGRRDVITSALQAVIDLPEHGPQGFDSALKQIYRDTLQQILNQHPDIDRMYLTEAQVEITKSALRRFIESCSESGCQALAENMLRQLTLTRRQYAAG